ncbi:MAG: hypothetical protein D6782_07780, partial [Alphaproteobacteria bacterium]
MIRWTLIAPAAIVQQSRWRLPPIWVKQAAWHAKGKTVSIWGKLVGGAAGLITGGPLGALVGAGLGHAVDRRIEAAGGPRSDAAVTKITFTIGVVALAAKMAKA